jgi:formate dehydrogenase
MDGALEGELGAAFEAELDGMLPKCDVVVLNMPLTEKTK